MTDVSTVGLNGYPWFHEACKPWLVLMGSATVALSRGTLDIDDIPEVAEWVTYGYKLLRQRLDALMDPEAANSHFWVNAGPNWGGYCKFCGVRKSRKGDRKKDCELRLVAQILNR